MTASPAQIAANRRNALLSKGPTSPEGKSAVRRSALKHGLRASPGALPNEDPAVAEARARAWNVSYQPQTPESQHLVNECVRVSLLSDRVDAYNHAEVSAQVLDADLAWENARADEVQSHIDRLKADPADARVALGETAAGCRWLVLRWEALLHTLDMAGKWSRSDRAEAIRLMGCKPGRGLQRNPEAWEVWLLGALMPVKTPEDEIARGFQDDRMPLPMRSVYQLDRLPRYTEAAARLVAVIGAEISALRARAEWLHDHVDVPERAAAAERAMVLEGDKGRLFLRYHSEVRNTFHRASKALKLALDAEREALAFLAAGLPELPAGFSPNKPNFAPEAEHGRPADPPQVVANMPVADESIGTAVAGGSGEVAAPVANVDRPIESTGAGDEGAGLFYWARAGRATHPFAETPLDSALDAVWEGVLEPSGSGAHA